MRTTKPTPGRTRGKRIAAWIGAVALVTTAVALGRQPAPEPRTPAETPGHPQWAERHYGDPDAPSYRARNIVSIDFLGRPMFVHRDAARHFLRLERLFEARAPAYAALVAEGEVDDWSYINRSVRGGEAKSMHAFGLAIDVNALTNPLGVEGDMPMEVVEQWEAEGGGWGGRWSRVDPMHFETRLTPQEIRRRYHRDGTPRDWYLERLTGG
ncbi:MAG TPA: M15 family metallopeptidase [Actinomycetota bacterium]|jgi:hypothetical protein|nr:M15 family metallopeptidase [Actinomycetota bacterium]